MDDNARYTIDTSVAADLKGFGRSRVRISGNTDSVGNEPANERLSWTRASSAVNYLVQKYGFDKNRFVVVGNGSTKPVASNATKEGKQANRRTDFEFIDNNDK